MDIEDGVYRVGGSIIEILSNNWLKCTINPIVNPIPVYSHFTRDNINIISGNKIYFNRRTRSSGKNYLPTLLETTRATL
jgi:hypothetical protein